MCDRIDIRHLEVHCHIGVPEEERANEQKLLISVSIKGYFAKAAEKDDVGLTTNYYDLAQRIKVIASQRPRKLIETLAEDVASALLVEFSLRKVEVEVKKFILPDAEWVAVRVSRKDKKKSKSH